jgi:hypothetical protein
MADMGQMGTQLLHATHFLLSICIDKSSALRLSSSAGCRFMPDAKPVDEKSSKHDKSVGSFFRSSLIFNEY